MNELQFGAPLYVQASRSALHSAFLLIMMTEMYIYSPAGMAAVLQARLTEPVVRKVMLTAHRYTAPEALASGLVDEIVPADGSEAAISFAITKAMGMAPLAESGVSCP
jgi:enoyl-CoA hydratase/carnithine racemase